MFCPKCGASEQSPETYCRACGEFLVSSNISSRLAFGGTTPQQNLSAINFLSLVAATLSLLAAILMYATSFNIPVVLYLGAAILLCNAGWHVSNFYIGMKLKRRLKQANEQPSESVSELGTASTRELLPPPKPDEAIPISVTENTTKALAEKLERPSA